MRIDDHDQVTKLNQAKKFLEEGHKVQFNLMFRGREMAHIDLGRNIMEKFKTDLAEIAKPEREPQAGGQADDHDSHAQGALREGPWGRLSRVRGIAAPSG